MNKDRVMKLALRFLLAIIIIVCVFLFLLNFNIITLNSSDLPEVLTLNHSELGILVGDTYELKPSVFPSGKYSGRIVWSSSNDKIATVNETTGFIEAHQVGNVIIKASLPMNNLEAECLLHVVKDDVLIHKVSFYNEEINLAIGESYDLNYSVIPANATIYDFDFISSDTSIVLVNENGVIRTMKEGSAVVTIRSKINNVKDTIKINVYRYKNTSSKETILLSNNGTYIDKNIYYKTKSIILSENNLELNVGSKTNIGAKVYPSNANEKINWSSSNSNVVLVNDDGVISAINEGEAKIIATSIDGLISICNVIVKKDVENSSMLDIKDDVLDLKIGETKLIDTKFYFANRNTNIEWSSSNKNIASVFNGVVYANNTGTCTIKAISSDNKYSDHITVNIVKPNDFVEVNSIVIDDSSYVAKINETITLNPIINPSNATNRFISWTSSNPKVATVTNGVVYCLSEGKTEIEAICGNHKATVEIVVENIYSSLVTINQEEKVIHVAKNRSLYLTKTIVPLNTTNQQVTWTSSNNSIVKVNQYGMITGLKNGKATISVRTTNGKTASIEVRVI